MLKNKAQNKTRKNSTDADTSLTLATGHQRQDIVELILRYKSQAFAKELDAAVRDYLEKPSDNQERLLKLLQSSAMVHRHLIRPILTMRNKDGCTTLIRASAKGHDVIVALLLKHGAQVDEQNKYKATALMAASYRRQAGTAELLIKHRANINLQSSGGDTALMLATLNGHLAVVERLLEHNPLIHIQDNDGSTAFDYARARGVLSDILELLTRHTLRLNLAPMHDQLQQQIDDKFAKMLGSALHDYLEQPDENRSRLFALLMSPDMANEALIQLIITIKDKDGRTALIQASSCNHIDIVELLLEHDIPINSKDSDGNTALMDASAKGYATIVELLLEHDARVDVQDKNGKTALMKASDKGYAVVAGLFKNYEKK